MHADYEPFQIVRLTFGHDDNAFHNDRQSVTYYWGGFPEEYEFLKKRPCLILDVDNNNDRLLIIPGSRKENEDAVLLEKDENNGLEDTTGFLIEHAEWIDLRGEIIGKINHAEIQEFEEIDITQLGKKSPDYSRGPRRLVTNIGVHDIVLVEGKQAIVAKSIDSSLDIVYLSEQLSENDRLILTPNKRNNLDSKMSIPLRFKPSKIPEINVQLIGELNRKNKIIFEDKIRVFFKMM